MLLTYNAALWCLDVPLPPSPSKHFLSADISWGAAPKSPVSQSSVGFNLESARLPYSHSCWSLKVYEPESKQLCLTGAFSLCGFLFLCFFSIRPFFCPATQSSLMLETKPKHTGSLFTDIHDTSQKQPQLYLQIRTGTMQDAPTNRMYVCGGREGGRGIRGCVTCGTREVYVCEKKSQGLTLLSALGTWKNIPSCWHDELESSKGENLIRHTRHSDAERCSRTQMMGWFWALSGGLCTYFCFVLLLRVRGFPCRFADRNSSVRYSVINKSKEGISDIKAASCVSSLPALPLLTNPGLS